MTEEAELWQYNIILIEYMIRYSSGGWLSLKWIYRTEGWEPNMLYNIMRVIAYIVLKTVFLVFPAGLVVEGRENIPEKGGVLITPNHISFADPPTVGLANTRHCYIMAWDKLFAVPVLGQLITSLRAFPVTPGTADRAALKFAEGKLKAGEAVILFPEGGVSQDGQLRPVLPGAILLAQRANVPLVPTIVINTNVMLPYEKVRLRFTREKVIVRFGRKVMAADLTQGEKGSLGLRHGAERLHALMLALQQGLPEPDLKSIALDLTPQPHVQ